jgi:hypothetical protein
MMIDIAEEEYKIDIRKNSEQSTILNTKNSKQCSPVICSGEDSLLSKN